MKVVVKVLESKTMPVYREFTGEALAFPPTPGREFVIDYGDGTGLRTTRVVSVVNVGPRARPAYEFRTKNSKYRAWEVQTDPTLAVK